MNPEIKQRWADACRSPEYQQARGQLCGTLVKDPAPGVPRGTFCCLGVLTDLWVREDPENRAWYGSDNERYRVGPGVTAVPIYGSFLPRDVQEWAGLRMANPDVRLTHVDVSNVDVPNAVRSLSFLNDELHRTLPQIGDVIAADPSL